MKTEIRLPLGLPDFEVLKQSIQKQKVILDVKMTALPLRCPFAVSLLAY
ncbi:hypothetical protein QS257_07250 [Terrilactibacillus sp. S3-3]|nr:hypothetical protein QS257_07250 [Terrilactibacillus sp. S3-3]